MSWWCRKKTSEQSILLIDIDGVIAPILTYPQDGDSVIKSQWATWIIPAGTIDFLRQANESAEIVWCSNWQEYSNDASRELLGEEFDFIKFPTGDGKNSSVWVKHQSIMRFVKKHASRNIVIVDDEMTNESKKEFEKLGCSCVIPNGDDGLSDDDKIRILNLLK